MGDGEHDGRWDVTYSKTGYIVGGQLPGLGHGYRRFATRRSQTSWRPCYRHRAQASRYVSPIGRTLAKGVGPR